MSNLITEISNYAIVLSCLMMFFVCVHWIIKRDLSEYTELFVALWGLINLFIAIRVGYWAVALSAAIDGEIWADWFIQNKAIMTFPMSVGFVLVNTWFIRMFEGMTVLRMAIVIVFIYTVAIILGVM